MIDTHPLSQPLQGDGDRNTSQRNQAVYLKGNDNETMQSAVVAVLTESVILAADGLSSAATSSPADDGDGIALKTNRNVQVLKNDAQEREEASQSAILCFSGDGLAALNRTGVAVARRDGCGSSTRGGDCDSGSRGFTSPFRNGSRRGDRKGEESEECW